MRVQKALLLAVLLGAAGIAAAQNQPASALDQIVDRIASREQALDKAMRQYSPLVETYIQNLRPDKELGAVPAGDRYFLGRAKFGEDFELHPLAEKTGVGHRLFGNIGNFFSFKLKYLPEGFLSMVFVDTNGFNRQNYNFEYVRREFLGDVRCLVFDVTPKKEAGKGRFVGRIWVDDQDYAIVRFNGGFTGSSRSNFYFHFDSWRMNVTPGVWLPAFVYSEETGMPYGLWKQLQFKAQMRLWGYNLGPASREQELSRILVEASAPVQDQSETSKDLSPIQSQRVWDRQAEENVVERLERIGLLAPRGEVDKVLETVVNNLEVTNNLEIEPEVRCRVLLTSTLESFTVSHTIVLSRGLIDVLPDEATLATIVAHELAHVALGHRIDSDFAFNDRMMFKDEETFQHFYFGRNQAEEGAANQKALELLQKSPYKDQLAHAGRFVRALQNREQEIPNLISPHLGNRVPVNAQLASAAEKTEAKADKPETKQGPELLVALPLGSRVKMDPWSDRLEMIKSKPLGSVAEREKMPFEVTPFMPYLTRVNLPGSQAASATAKPEEQKPQQ